MTYQGERAREIATEKGRVFEVSKVRLGADGHVSEVLWGEVDAASDHEVGPRVLAPAAELVDAIHDGAQVVAVFPPSKRRLPERAFVIALHEDGRECIAFGGALSPGRELADMASLEQRDDVAAQRPVPADVPLAGGPAATFAVSKVQLDSDGRVTAVLWGQVDTRKNAWAGPEAVAPVAEVARALDAGHAVFALFPSANGHLPERRFVAVDYDGGRRAIVLQGPATREREVHDMDRLA
jgi:hypothetical protein